MERIILVIPLLVLLLTGCITEVKGRQPPKENLSEAARLNLEMGIGYFRQGDLRAAKVKLERAIEDEPELVLAYTVLGLVYERLGDSAGAEKNYRRAVALAPDDPDALNSLAAFLCHDSETSAEGLRLFDRALLIPISQTYSNKAMLNTNAGTCAKTTDLPRAENYLRAALGTDPSYPDALLQLADVSYQRSNYLQSRAFLQRYMAVEEASPAVLWLGMQLEIAMGNVQAADEFGARLQEEFPESVETRRLLEQMRDAG
jgi:type IV pilus assembly protein PilF